MNQPGSITKKHIAQVSYEPITVKAGIPLSPALTSCLAALCDNRANPVTLELSGSDGQNLQAVNAQLIAATFSALDSSSRDPVEITFVFQADIVRQATASAAARANFGKTVRALSSQFLFSLGNLDGSRVSRIDSFTITRAAQDASDGGGRLPTAAVGATKFPNLSVVTSDAGAASWRSWRDDFLVQGNHLEANELDGSLTLLASDMTTPLLSLKISHAGLIRFAHNNDSAEAIQRSTATLYCEQITLAPPNTTPTQPAPPTDTSRTPPTKSPVPLPGKFVPVPKKSTSADAGLRDPAGFPRAEGLTRTSYSKSGPDSRINEAANYSSEQDVDSLSEAYLKLLDAAGWKKETMNESGSSPEDHVIMSYWRKEKAQADLRIYAAKSGSTVFVSVTTEK
jgi:hypothetical protein